MISVPSLIAEQLDFLDLPQFPIIVNINYAEHITVISNFVSNFKSSFAIPLKPEQRCGLRKDIKKTKVFGGKLSQVVKIFKEIKVILMYNYINLRIRTIYS